MEGGLPKCLIDVIADIACEWKGTSEGWGDGVEHVHGAVIAFQHKIHFKFSLGDIEQLHSDSRETLFLIILLRHTFGEH